MEGSVTVRKPSNLMCIPHCNYMVPVFLRNGSQKTQEKRVQLSASGAVGRDKLDPFQF